MRAAAIASAACMWLSLGASLPASDWSVTVKRVEPSVVFVQTDDGGGCTGFVIDSVRKLVLTAGHCRKQESGHDESGLWVDRVVARLVSWDTQKDLLVAEAKDMADRPALTIAAGDPEIGQEVMSVGYGYALARPFFRRAHVSDDKVNIPQRNIGGPFIGLDAAFVPGQSGGPVVNIAGEVVSIVQLASDRDGVGVGAAVIRERMGRFLGAPPVKTK